MTGRRRMVIAAIIVVAFGLGVASGLVLSVVLEGSPESSPVGGVSDPRQVGLSWAWLAFGFTAQAIFMSRMLLQWLVSEKRRRSVVPVGFWWLSLCGGLMLLAYFLRRGDPVGTVGQLFGVLVYSRNLYFIYRPSDAPTRRLGHWWSSLLAHRK